MYCDETLIVQPVAVPVRVVAVPVRANGMMGPKLRVRVKLCRPDGPDRAGHDHQVPETAQASAAKTAPRQNLTATLVAATLVAAATRALMSR